MDATNNTSVMRFAEGDEEEKPEDSRGSSTPSLPPLPEGMVDHLDGPSEGTEDDGERVWRRCIIVDPIADMPGALPPLTPLLERDPPE
jgi:hypothetical protein